MTALITELMLPLTMVRFSIGSVCLSCVHRLCLWLRLVYISASFLPTPIFPSPPGAVGWSAQILRRSVHHFAFSGCSLWYPFRFYLHTGFFELFATKFCSLVWYRFQALPGRSLQLFSLNASSGMFILVHFTGSNASQHHFAKYSILPNIHYINVFVPFVNSRLLARGRPLSSVRTLQID